MGIIEWTVLMVLFGLVVGSFLNVVIVRTPNEQSFVTGRSHCPHCQHLLQFNDLFPVLSYFALRGKCRYCHGSISWLYPFIEIVTATFFGWCAYRYGFHLQAGIVALWGCFLIALATIDARTQFLPDTLTYPFLWFGLLISTTPFGWVSPSTAIWGAFFGYMSLWCLYWAFKWITGKDGLGYGDFKLLAGLGAWFGWQALPLILLMAASIGTIVGLVLILSKKQSRSHPIPFGPFLVLGALLMLLNPIAFYPPLA